MFFVLGINEKREDLADEQLVTCERCGSYGRYLVFMTYSVLSLFFIPIFRWNRHYYVEMSCCRALYELDPEIGRQIASGQNVEIRNEDLTLLSSGYGNTYKKCSYCGYETNEDFAFCPKCGNRFE